jgi:XTP/dITP diphosphohydrolase
LGTRNRKKRDELAELLTGLPLEVKTLDDFPDAPEVVEDGATFAENARKKARDLATTLDAWVLGEDSGLVVDALGGRPREYHRTFGELGPLVKRYLSHRARALEAMRLQLTRIVMSGEMAPHGRE